MNLFNTGLFGFGVNLLFCGIAAFNLIIDFDNIEVASQYVLPKYYEWYFGFALMVTLIWLYLEILRILARANRRN